ncbi:unnamed protein product [Didymodactylos carnosus]|uniref:Ferric-chelate reductase 1 n=1 Tax=Didymodactylos carnosus TaxID=1234261 RepID=A0A813T2Q1_9BILA|nr:unnamed protein product [Didymodactylos carnosus]CAF3591917.1 unnamed protein product [Didymodactylos carnosus]
MHSNYWFYLLLMLVKNINSYPSGAPSGACTTMIPAHGLHPSTCTNNYIIEPSSSSYQAGDSILVKVKGININDKFRGILLMAFDTNSNVIGTWDPVDSNVQNVACGNDKYVFVCGISSDEFIQLKRMHTKAGKRRPSQASEELNVIDTSFADGKAICQFSFELNSVQVNDEPVPIVKTEDYYIIFAAGRLNDDKIIQKHTQNFVTTKTYQFEQDKDIDLDEISITTTIPATTTISGSASPSTASHPSSGSSNYPVSTESSANDVGVNVTWNYFRGMTNVRMTINNLKSQQWIAIGLSTDELMGNDHVFVCQHLANNTVAVKRLINPGGHSQSIDAPPSSGGTLTPNQWKVENGVVTCEFTLSNFDVSEKRWKRQESIAALSQTAQYYPLIAIGALDTSNTMQRHSSRQAESKLVSLNRQEHIVHNLNSFSNNRANLMKAHGCIMIFTWMLIVSTGILIARYFKNTWSNRKLCGKAVWFSVHRALMSCAAILTSLAFVFILIYRQGSWVEKSQSKEYAHSIVGILVVVFAFIQPIMALFRCHPEHLYRFIYNYLHALVGFSALVLSISAIFLALYFSIFNFKTNNSWAIMTAWSCWIVLIFFIFECLEFCFKNDRRSEKNDAYQLDSNGHANGTISEATDEEKSNPIKDKLKGLLLILHILVAFGLSLALVIIIGQSQ